MAESISEDISGSMGMIESMIDKSASDPSKKFQSSSQITSVVPTEVIGLSRSKMPEEIPEEEDIIIEDSIPMDSNI